MSLRRWVAGTLVFVAAAVAAGAARGRDDDAELRRKVDQEFAVYDKSDSPGCALGVVRDGNFIYERGYGMGSLELSVPLTPESVVYLGSVSKQFTAATVVLAAEQGYLSLDDDVRKFLPELPSYGKTITLREMLHHTSGFRDVLSLMFLSGRNAEDVHSPEEMLDLIVRQKALNFSPGDEFLYSNTNYFLMGVVIQRTTGKSLAQFAEENIFKPLGMSHTRFYDDRSFVMPGRVAAYSPRAEGGFRVDWSTNYEQVGGGGLMSTVDDLMLWDRNFYNNKLEKSALAHELQTPGVLNNGKPIEYALGLFVTKHRGLPLVAHDGALFGYRSALLRFPEQKFSVICLCNVGSAQALDKAMKVADIYLARQLAPDAVGTAGVKVDPRAFAGMYRSAESHAVLEVKASDTDLEIFGDRFKARDATHFVGGPGAEMAFEHAGGGTRLTLTSEAEPPQVFETYQAVKPSSDELAQIAGEYRSEELQATYRIAAKNGKLFVAVNWQEPFVLNPTVRDEFQGTEGTAIVFRRDASRRVSGFDLFAGRVRNISFSRVGK